MLRQELKYYRTGCSIALLCIWSTLFFSACSEQGRQQTDTLNELSYAYHYRNLDSTELYARKALSAATHYDAGKAEAFNNLAFVNIARMDFVKAAEMLDSAINITDNQVELMVAEIQYMRLCQRQSNNKQFYDHQEKARKYMERIEVERNLLNEHQDARFVYAKSEYYINSSIYYYYLGLTEPSVKMIESIDAEGEIKSDSAQYLYYLYNIGAGGIIAGEDSKAVAQEEFSLLMKCYLLAEQGGYPYWMAQAMQALSEHMLQPSTSPQLLKANYPFIEYVNIDGMPDSLLAGNLAQRSLNLFTKYGDVYQTAGAHRTLASCYWEIKDYPSALICLNNALYTDTIINRAPDLVASIREQLCLVYSAQNDKAMSDFNRNIYLDLQDQTRQDKQLEARADQLNSSVRTLNIMLVAVLLMIVFTFGLFFFLAHKRKRDERNFSVESMLDPLRKWKENNERLKAELLEQIEEIEERTEFVRMNVAKFRQRNLEQRAKLAIVNSITPFIDRIINEINRLANCREEENVRLERYEYIHELTDIINEYNNVLTKWIQMQQGNINLHIESFPLQQLFDIVKKSRTGFALHGVDLDVRTTEAIVKADRTLTLFMVNTIADNARKFTPAGGHVTIMAQEESDYVEISVEDDGVGMSAEQVDHLFDNKPVSDDGSLRSGGHGFGLLNCKGIIEKYKKISRIFSVCDIQASSEKGKGSRLAFRLPKGGRRLIMLIGILMCCQLASADKISSRTEFTHSIKTYHLRRAAMFADSAYYANLEGKPELTLTYADSCIVYLNRHARKVMPKTRNIPMMVRYSTASVLPAEIIWFHDGMKTSYDVILDIRNETAVAALSLHMWDLYMYNNKVYTKLYHECCADTSLPHYVRTMQRSRNNMAVAVSILVILLLSILPISYIVYFRHRLYYRFCIDRVNNINEILLSQLTDEEKLRRIEALCHKKSKLGLQKFDEVISQIVSSLKTSVDVTAKSREQVELAQDELRKAEYESDALHVSNSVMDNCLSALKHETMYYPSRIQQLAVGADSNLNTLSEVVTYYKQLYSMLSEQAMRQVDKPMKADRDMLLLLMDILQKTNKGCKITTTAIDKDSEYVCVSATLTELHLDDKQVKELFTAQTIDLNFLLCKQIVREIGEYTNKRACGILARDNNIIEIILPKNIWKILAL